MALGWPTTAPTIARPAPAVGFSYANFSGESSIYFSDDVGPGRCSNLFHFVAAEASSPAFYVTNGDQTFCITPNGSPTPEPSTWAMLIAGFGFLGWRYTLQRGGLRRLFRAA
jgi:hypothetical protein